MAFFGRLWRGEYPLVKTFWLFGVLPNVVFSFASQAAIDARTAIDASNEFGTGFFLGVLYLPYYIAIVGGVWRSANVHCATEGKSTFWGRSAQVVVIIGFTAFVFGLFALMTQM